MEKPFKECVVLVFRIKEDLEAFDFIFDSLDEIPVPEPDSEILGSLLIFKRPER